jgi:acetylornithine deacetylase/succinyl-diaminopimelate desuccinylase-like protein
MSQSNENFMELINKKNFSVDGDQILKLAQELIRFPSFTYKESEVAHYLYKYLKEFGLECELQKVQLPGNCETNQVITRLKGSRPGKKALLCGHLDVLDVHRRELWTNEPFDPKISDGWLYGHGSLNMKAGIAALIGAITAIKNLGTDFSGEIVLANVAAEIIGGNGINYFLSTENNFDYSIVAEPTNLCISNISVGTCQGVVRFWGNTHYYKPHTNSIYIMSKFIEEVGPSYLHLKPDKWMTYTPCDELPGFPRFNIRSIQSGQDYCEIFFDARIVPGQNNSTIMADLLEISEKIESRYPDVRTEIIIPKTNEFFNFPAITATCSDLPFIKELVDNHKEIVGKLPIVSSGDRIGLASDASHIKARGIPAVDYGPGFHPHWPLLDERIRIEDILISSEVIYRTIKKIHA